MKPEERVWRNRRQRRGRARTRVVEPNSIIERARDRVFEDKVKRGGRPNPR